MNPRDETLLRFSLVAVWLATACVSLWEFEGQSLGLLANAGVVDRGIATMLVVAGAGVDLLLGIALALLPSRRVYAAALAVMLAMTAVATVLDPSLWLHPLGPLTKNVPIAAILWILLRTPK